MIVKSMGYAPDAKIAIYPKQPVVHLSFLEPLDCSLKYLFTWDLSSNTVQYSCSVVVKMGTVGFEPMTSFSLL